MSDLVTVLEEHYALADEMLVTLPIGRLRTMIAAAVARHEQQRKTGLILNPPPDLSGVLSLLEQRQYLPGDVVFREDGPLRRPLAGRDFLHAAGQVVWLATHDDEVGQQQCYRQVLATRAAP
jgi:hypothetical protein